MAPLALAALAALLALPLTLAACPNMCTGHGRCVEVSRCACFAGWHGGDCSLRACPLGPAWADVATAVDTAHAPVECSGRGACDARTGACACEPGFEGPACARLACAAGCGGHGTCVTLREHAAGIDPGVLPAELPYVNVRAPWAYRLWDADMVRGCACDAGYAGARCEERVCPVGDDPMTTGQVDEVQLLRCDLDPAAPQWAAPAFTLSFRGAVTRPFSAAINPVGLKRLLEELPTIRSVSVAYSGAALTFCDASFSASASAAQPASGNVVAVTFLSEHGALPRLVVLDEKAAPLYGVRDNYVSTAAGGESLAAAVAAPPGVALFTSLAGTKESAPCSGRGLCDTRDGVCVCAPGFGSSDGRGGEGRVADCGHAYLPITGCPTSGGVECGGRGACSGYPAYACACDAGWAGANCAARACPLGRAWFAYPSADDDAHPLVPCAGEGACDARSGECACLPGFEGAACERLKCPADAAGTPCGGHGECLDVAALAAFAADNGDPAPTSYGADPSKLATWDAHSARACRCDAGFEGPACASRTCPRGNDVTLLEADATRLDEAQALSCVLLGAGGAGAAAPVFSLSFRGEATPPLPAGVTAAALAAALSALSTTGGLVRVAFTVPLGQAAPTAATPFCSPLAGATRVTAAISFHTAHGALPPVRVVMDESTRDPLLFTYGAPGAPSGGLGWLSTQLEFTGGDAAAGYTTPAVFQPPYPATGVRALRTRPGTSGNDVCSARGLCDAATGACQCFIGFAASDNNRGRGAVENCGWRDDVPGVGLRGAGRARAADAAHA